MPRQNSRHRRLYLSIFAAATVLTLNAVAVANGWSPFRVSGHAAQARQSQAASHRRPGLHADPVISAVMERS